MVRRYSTSTVQSDSTEKSYCKNPICNDNPTLPTLMMLPPSCYSYEYSYRTSCNPCCINPSCYSYNVGRRQQPNLLANGISEETPSFGLDTNRAHATKIISKQKACDAAQKEEYDEPAPPAAVALLDFYE